MEMKFTRSNVVNLPTIDKIDAESELNRMNSELLNDLTTLISHYNALNNEIY